MIEHNIPAKVYITEAEHGRLLLYSGHDQTALVSFGGGRVWLDEVESNAWAFKLLLEWRGLST